MPPSKVGERSSIQKNTRSGLLFFLFFLHLPNSKETFFSTIVASENIAIVLYLPCSRQRTSYVEDRTIDVRTFPFPWDIWFDIFVFGLLSSWVLSSEDSFSVVYIYRAAVTKITFGLVTTDYMRDIRICEIKFIHYEKATKFYEISIVELSYVVPVKSTVEISQNFPAFSEYMNFKFQGLPF